jgi:hypothetical protein
MSIGKTSDKNPYYFSGGSVKAYNAKAKQRIRVEASKWIEAGEVVTVTPSNITNCLDTWYAGNIYVGLDGHLFEIVSVISAS